MQRIMETEKFYPIRRQLHRLAEISGQEIHTSRYIQRVLRQVAPSATCQPVGTHGIIAEFHFPKNGPTLLFRADTDAVAMSETTTLPYCSQQAGAAHKCGHDGHTAILLATAARIHRNPLDCGRLLLLFQPAEETGQGAQAILRDPWFRRQKIDYAFALHNLPGYPAGAIVCRPGSFTCSVISCSITLTGKTSHAAEPEKAISPTQALLALLQGAESWNCGDLASPDYFRTTLVELHIGKETYGVTAGNGILRMTLRATTATNLQRHIEQLQELIRKHTGSSSGLHCTVEWLEPFTANENHPQIVKRIQQIAQRNAYPYIEPPYPFAWGEDFGLFMQHYPGAMFGLGAGLDIPALHTPEYDFPDEIIATGAGMFYGIAKEFQKRV